MAEMVGGKSGKDLILAVSLGNDLPVRPNRSSAGFRLSLVPAAVVGIFGATAAAASLMQADAEQHRLPSGLALPMAGAPGHPLRTGSSVRSIRDGLTYRNGVLAARMAMDGMRGEQKVFDGSMASSSPSFSANTDRQVVALGSSRGTEHVSLKPGHRTDCCTR